MTDNAIAQAGFKIAYAMTTDHHSASSEVQAAETGKNVPDKCNTPSVLRASRVLDLLSQSATPLSLAQLSRMLELPKSSLHGLCATLSQCRLVTKLDSGHMTLGPHVMNWAHAFLARNDMTQEFFTAWEEVNDRINHLKRETITLSVLDGDCVVYIACRAGTQPLGLTFRIGMRMPAPYTATGKAIFSTFPDSEVRERLKGKWPSPLTSAGIPDLAGFLAELEVVRARGYSIDNGEVRKGMCCYGAPVFNSTSKQAVAGIAASILMTAADQDKQGEMGAAVRVLADRLSERMGANMELIRC